MSTTAFAARVLEMHGADPAAAAAATQHMAQELGGLLAPYQAATGGGGAPLQPLRASAKRCGALTLTLPLRGHHAGQP